MKCFYHNADLDGHCSGEIIRHVFPECELIGINYGDEFPWDSIQLGEVVYMVDFSLQPFSDMVRLWHTSELIWIDHHKSAIEEAQASGVDFAGVQVSGIGACALVWKFLARQRLLPEKIPDGVRLLAEYDVWDHSDTNCLPFQYGMRLRDHAPGASVWDRVLGDLGLGFVISEGETALAYERQQNAIRAKALCFEVELHGLRCIAANQGLTNSQLFDSVWDSARYDAMLTFHWRKGRWNVSLYSDKPEADVSIVAKACGGGGHKGAAGFQCDDLPFKLK